MTGIRVVCCESLPGGKSLPGQRSERIGHLRCRCIKRPGYGWPCRFGRRPLVPPTAVGRAPHAPHDRRLTAGCVHAPARRHASNLRVHSGRGMERGAGHQRKKLESQGQGWALLGAPRTQHLCRYITRPAPTSAWHSSGPGRWCLRHPTLTGMSLVVIQYEASDRVDVGLLGSDAVVLAPDPTRSWSKRRGLRLAAAAPPAAHARARATRARWSPLAASAARPAPRPARGTQTG